jgi:hypothetical protein
VGVRTIQHNRATRTQNVKCSNEAQLCKSSTHHPEEHATMSTSRQKRNFAQTSAPKKSTSQGNPDGAANFERSCEQYFLYLILAATVAKTASKAALASARASAPAFSAKFCTEDFSWVAMTPLQKTLRREPFAKSGSTSLSLPQQSCARDNCTAVYFHLAAQYFNL